MIEASGARAAVLLALLGALAQTGCDRCGPAAAPLATLQAVQGSDVARDLADAQQDWRPANPGDTFALGDGLRTGAGAKAVLVLIDASTLTVQPHTLIRFKTARAAKQQHIQVHTGEATLKAGPRPLTLETLFGTAVLQSGSLVRLVKTADAVRYEVELGSAAFVSAKTGERVEVREGEHYEVGIGEAVMRSHPIPELTTEPLAQLASAEAPVDESWGEPGARHAELQLRAGASITVHAPDRPITVGLALENVCPDLAVVERARPLGRFYGRGLVGVELSAARSRYEVRCVVDGKLEREARARGTVHVLRDSGTRHLPRRAPLNRVEADGRTYNILYQNQPPAVVVSWPRPPHTDRYVARVDGKPRAVSAPSLRFDSGELPDGRHSVVFEAAGRRSRPATIRLGLDSTAPKASLTAPEDHSFAPGETVPVRGRVLPGWKVEAERGTIDLDSSQRFSGNVTTSPDHPAVVLRLTHPQQGTHYYLRRAKQSP